MAMPASTADPISSVLQRTFGGLDHKREGLIRGGNSSSASARPFSVDKQLQASTKHGLVVNNGMEPSISFDAPTSFKSDTQALHPKVIVLNPGAAKATNGHNDSQKQNETADTKEGVPVAKVTLYNPAEIRVGYAQTRVAGAGMANAGNTCYLNSTLQALFHTPALYNYLIHASHQHMSRCSSSMSANGFLQTCTICSMVHTLKDSLKTSVIRPNRIYEKLKIICKHMVQGRQEDAHEFLRYLIDSLQRSYLNTIPGSKQFDAVTKETTPFNQIFGGYMRQEVTCIRCKHVSTTFQHFMDILVDIQQANTIDEALAHFFRQKKLGYAGDEASLYKCEKCKVKVQAKWQCFLERPPPVLCVQLKRFSILGGKIGKPIQLSRSLNISPFLKQANGKVEYLLRSMITHVGPSPNCGHYTAIGEAANGQFFQFDDASVRPIPLQQVLRTASYVVFYEMTPASWAAQLAKSGQKPSQSISRPLSSPQVQPRAGTPARIPIQASPSPQPKIINKIGVVSSAAKSMVSSAFNDIAKTVTSKKGLVPYDNDTSDEETNGTEAKKDLPKPSFVPRSVAIKSLVEKPVKVLEKPVKAFSATARNWTVTDNDHHNPSVHSDNSTGSTSNSWIITPQRPNSAMSEDGASTKSSKWTVTTLKRAIEEDPQPQQQQQQSLSASSTTTSETSTPNSSASSTKEDKSSSSFRKRPSVDESNSDYDDELDRGRTKKVRKSVPQQQPRHEYNSENNPFQRQQDWQNRSKMSNGYRSNHWGEDNRSSSRDNYQRSRYYHDRDRNNYSNGGGRRKSFGGGGFRDGKDKYYHGGHHGHRRYSSSGGGGHHESNHYRDSFHRRSSR